MAILIFSLMLLTPIFIYNEIIPYNMETCRKNEERLNSYFNHKKNVLNYCEQDTDCFFIDSRSGFHSNYKEVFQLQQCLIHINFLARRPCHDPKVKARGSGWSDSFNIKSDRPPSSYKCIRKKCIPHYGEEKRNWGREALELFREMRKKQGGHTLLTPECKADFKKFFKTTE